MALPHAAPGEVVRILPNPAHAVADPGPRALVLGAQMEVARLPMAAGDSLPPHRLKDEASLQCLQGTVRVQIGAEARLLNAGDLLCLPRQTEYSLHGETAALLLLTFVRPHAETTAR